MPVWAVLLGLAVGFCCCTHLDGKRWGDGALPRPNIWGMVKTRANCQNDNLSFGDHFGHICSRVGAYA